MILSDEWAAYRRLGSIGYEHKTVNHSEHFVDPETGAHTQNIERLWKDVKGWILKSGIRKEYLKQYFARYLFVNNFPDRASRLHHFLLQAAALYPPQRDPPQQDTPDDPQPIDDPQPGPSNPRI